MKNEMNLTGRAPRENCACGLTGRRAWMTEALPIGNGPLGATLFGGTELERVQFNEISLWSGTRMAVDARFTIAAMAEGNDPCYRTGETLKVKCRLNGEPAEFTGADPETVNLVEQE